MKNICSIKLFVFPKISSYFKWLFVLLLLILSLRSLNASQNVNANDKFEYEGLKIFPSYGIDIGFFYPSDINDLVNDLLSGYDMDFGFPDLVLNMGAHVDLNIRINKLELIGKLEYNWVPKFITVSGGDDLYYHFDRMDL